MKKQILILILFVAAIVAGTSNAFGQKTYINYVEDAVSKDGIKCIVPTPLQNCTADELHPVQGQSYTYTVTATAQTDVRWFVVNYDSVYTVNGDSLIGYNGILPQNYSLIDPSNGNGAYIYGDGSTTITGYNVDPVADNTGQYHSIDITWKYFDGVVNTVLLVAYAEDSSGCTNNIEVYRIIPEPAFTIDIAALNDEGDSIAGPLDPIVGECVSNIESALYVAAGGNVLPSETPGDSLIVDYGENWVYFVVNGANYFDSWWPQFQISYDGGYKAIEAAWAYGADATSGTAANWHTLTDDGTNLWEGADKVADAVVAGGGGASTNAVGDGIIPAAAGECIVVRVRIDYGTQYEHDNAAESLHFAANGIAYDGDGADMFDNSVGGVADSGNFEDLKNNGTNGTDCEADGFTNDFMEYEITPRPEVENAIPSGTTTIDTETKTGDENN